MANEYCSKLSKWWNWRVVGLLIGWTFFVPLMTMFVHSSIALLLYLFRLNYDLVPENIIYIISGICNIAWIYGVTDYKPRYMLPGLIWCAFLAVRFNFGLLYGSEPRYLEEILLINLVFLLVFVLSLCCYISILRICSSQSQMNQNDSNVTQVIQTRRSIVPTAPNLTCEVPITDTGDSRDTKSLIMMVD